ALGDIDDALALLGVDDSTLPAAAAAQLDRDGYAVFPGLLDGSTTAALSRRLEELEEVEQAWTSGTRPEDPGSIRIDDVNHKGAVFDALWVHPLLLAAVHHCLGDFRLGSMTARAPRPGRGHQRLHTDWQGTFDRHGPGAERCLACNSVFMLDDFTAETGTTRFVPGSHLLRRHPEEVLDNARAAHPEQLLIEARRGSLAVFNGDLWHGGTKNTSAVLRRGVFTYFVGRDQPRGRDQRALLDEATRSRLGAAARYVLDA
ncbi:MAG TPA: phytanoyl-CoA dioxygenase family protein, partial [Acidimicrobiales bacterium]|nr:phytanoyl-CoA dioxygenase family protein [Acidimicrobiales bacterium]